MALSPGDLVLLFTDGLADLARHRRRTLDVASWLAASKSETPQDLVLELGAEIDRMCPPGEAPDDDITFVVVGVKPQ